MGVVIPAPEPESRGWFLGCGEYALIHYPHTGFRLAPE